MKPILFALITLMVSACSTTPTQVEILINSDPQGATIYNNGAVIGRAPSWVYFPSNPSFEKGGCFNTSELRVRWVSGASASSPLQLCGAVGFRQAFTFNRPNIEGRETDERFALEAERNAILRNQADAAQTAADAAVLQWLTPTPRK
jgi:hypothetical protein